METAPEPDATGGVHPSEAAGEAELLRRVRRGDADAFEQLARREAPRMFRLALRLTGDRDEAEDLVQGTLVRALPALRRFEGRAKLSTYLLRALSNQWKNRLRSKKRSRMVDWLFGRRPDGDGQPQEPEPVAADPSAEERLMAEDRAAAIRDAVTKLEPQRRLALLLHEIEEMPYEEIASVTGVPIGTVRSRIARAKGDLRALLGEKP